MGVRLELAGELVGESLSPSDPVTDGNRSQIPMLDNRAYV
jgi:hypothetical protein